jgi:NitT/TauT family transport system substrate-binding protein
MKRRNLLGGLALASAAALALAGCTDSAAPEPTSGSGGDTYQVRVAALPIAETGAIWAALEAGVFEEHGIELEILPAQGGAQAIPALVAGDIDFAIGQPMGPFRASLAGEEVRILSNYANSLASGDSDVNSVVAGADSGISTWADLSGKTVSVNSLGAAGDLTIRAAVKDAGGDPDSINFVAVNFPDVPAQIEAGAIDAAWAPDPFRGMVVSAGGTDLGGPYQATIPGLTVLTNFTLQKVIDEKPEMVEAWTAALTAALEYAASHEDEVRAAIEAGLGLPEGAAGGIVLPEFTADLSNAGLKKLVELAIEYKYFEAAPDLDAIVVQ